VRRSAIFSFLHSSGVLFLGRLIPFSDALVSRTLCCLVIGVIFFGRFISRKLYRLHCLGRFLSWTIHFLSVFQTLVCLGWFPFSDIFPFRTLFHRDAARRTPSLSLAFLLGRSCCSDAFLSWTVSVSGRISQSSRTKISRRAKGCIDATM
jgi:hypothetical protein